MNIILNTTVLFVMTITTPIATNATQSSFDGKQAPKRQKVEGEKSETAPSSEKKLSPEDDELYLRAIQNVANEVGPEAFEQAAGEGRIAVVQAILSFVATHPSEGTLLLAGANAAALNPLISAALYAELGVAETLLRFALEHPQWRAKLLAPEAAYSAFDTAVLDRADLTRGSAAEIKPETIVEMVRLFLGFASADPEFAKFLLSSEDGPFNNLFLNRDLPDAALAAVAQLFFEYIAAHPSESARLLNPVEGESALNVAVRNNNAITVAVILDFAQAHPHLARRLFVQESEGPSALHMAVEQGNEVITSLLIRSPFAHLFFTSPTTRIALTHILLNHPVIPEQLLRVFVVNLPHFFSEPVFQLVLQRDIGLRFAIPLAASAQNIAEVMRLIDAGFDFEDEVLLDILENTAHMRLDYHRVLPELSRNLELARTIGRPGGFDAAREARLVRLINIFRAHIGTVPTLRELAERAIRSNLENPSPQDFVAPANGDGRSPLAQRIHDMLRLDLTHNLFRGTGTTFFARTFAAFIRALQFHVDNKRS